ncbi:hypothetical protein LIER_31257 [Lithospermum erythrorhizon]|uniref:Pentatricopeptide repeat-containing protein n=1 Tax=Lithospermum erythrorhizon TaxID=34254 RepID=A0AAV3RWB0_LITER
MKEGVVGILGYYSIAVRPKSAAWSKSNYKPTKTNKVYPKRTLLKGIGLNCKRKDSLKYYAELASKLAEDGRLEDFLMIAESIPVAASSSSFASLVDVDLVSSGVSRLLQQGCFPIALRVLTCLDQLGFDVSLLFRRPDAILSLRHSLLHHPHLDQLLLFIHTLQGFNLAIQELVDLSGILRLCVNKRNPSAAIRICHIFPHSQMIFCTIILEFGKKRDLPAALTVFEASKQSLGSPNMFAYRTIIDVCGLCGDYMRSRSIYEELLARKFVPNVYVYNSLMNVNACDLRYSLQVYKQMKRLGVRADLASFNILLKSCCLAARVDLARDIYKEVQRLEAMGALKLDVFTYSTIIKVFADSKMWHMALNVKDDMLSAGVTPNTVTWISLISATANAGLVEQTICLFEEMLFAGCSPNAQCFNILLHACVESCQYDRAFRLFQSWKVNGCHETDRENGGDKHCRTGIDNADGNCVTNIPYQTFVPHSSRLPLRVPFKPTTSTYNTLMKACGTDYYRAKGLMDEMKKMGLSPNNISWSILIDICGSSGNVEGALQILRCMQEGGIQPDVITYTTAIKVCIESKNIRYAFLLYAEMKRYQIKPNMVTSLCLPLSLPFLLKINMRKS